MAAYTGLMTGAGAASGLEQLFARLRAEELLANQGRTVDIDELESQSTDRARRAQADLGQGTLAENTRQFEALAPGRDAATALNTASARESGVRSDTGEEQLGILRGLRLGDSGGGPSADAGAGDSQPGMGDPALNSPLGRIRLSAAGINPNNAFGPVNTSNTSDEQWFDSYFERLNGLKPGQGVGRGRELTFEERQEAAEMKPQTMIAQGNLDARTKEASIRQRKQELDIRSAELRLQQDEAVPPAMRPFLLAEFRNRIQNDVQSKQSWMQWLKGEEVADPSAQIDQILADVMSKAASGIPGTSGTPQAPPGGGGTRRRYNPATGRIE